MKENKMTHPDLSSKMLYMCVFVCVCVCVCVCVRVCSSRRFQTKSPILTIIPLFGALDTMKNPFSIETEKCYP